MIATGDGHATAAYGGAMGPATWRSTCHSGDADIGLPSGTAALALHGAELAASAASELTGRPHVVRRDAVLAQLLMPLIVGARPPASAPRPAPGGGYVHDDTSDADAPLVAALAAERAGAEALATAAQACWLPVTPYRPWSARSLDAGGNIGGRTPDLLPASAVGVRRRDPDTVRVLDLTAMWAGPLCTRLLAEWGAQVTTIEPAVRRDGLRGSPAQFEVLDHGKRRVDVDLRATAGRADFELLVAESDLVVESFSARVMPNLDYAPDQLRRINPRITTVSIRAFDASTPEAAWVAYGRGVHATSGMGMHAGRPQPASIAYPDPLTGFAAFHAALCALGADEPPPFVTVSLAGTIGSLLDAGERPLAVGDPSLVGALARTTAGATTAPITSTEGS